MEKYRVSVFDKETFELKFEFLSNFDIEFVNYNGCNDLSFFDLNNKHICVNLDKYYVIINAQ